VSTWAGLAQQQAPHATQVAMKFDLALILAVDCSSSVDVGDFRLQMDGIASALRNPQTAEAIAAGDEGRIALSLVQWSSQKGQFVSVKWHILATPADLEAVARIVESTERRWLPGGTGLAAAVEYCTALLGNFPLPAKRHVIDVSGDGEDNEGGDAARARDVAVALGFVINGLPILNGSHYVEAYYRRRVVGGPGSFVFPTLNMQTFRDTMAQKLQREIGPKTV
jgi:Protein of unknown function (DUF1194)